MVSGKVLDGWSKEIQEAMALGDPIVYEGAIAAYISNMDVPEKEIPPRLSKVFYFDAAFSLAPGIIVTNVGDILDPDPDGSGPEKAYLRAGVFGNGLSELCKKYKLSGGAQADMMFYAEEFVAKHRLKFARSEDLKFFGFPGLPGGRGGEIPLKYCA